MHIHETGLIALLGALSFGIVVSDGCGVLREHDVDSAGAVVVGQESDPTGEDVDAVAIFAVLRGTGMRGSGVHDGQTGAQNEPVPRLRG
jgi:hypothetical protein